MKELQPELAEKVCTKCKVLKPIREYYRSHSSKYASWCKECTKEAANLSSKKRYKADPEASKQRRKANRNKNIDKYREADRERDRRQRARDFQKMINKLKQNGPSWWGAAWLFELRY